MSDKTKKVKPEKRFIVKDQQSLDKGDILK